MTFFFNYDNYFDKLDKLISSSQKYNYIEEGTEDTLAQRVFDKWRDRYNNNISLAEMAEVNYHYFQFFFSSEVALSNQLIFLLLLLG